ncbi:ATP-binding cassette domain-containing protein [Enterocloster sp.]|uniref:ATP-binding cassette domain-containing protein n=1 Tax=Enterocloster sp. TaxID=2719315 RepID=UPI0039A0CEA9
MKTTKKFKALWLSMMLLHVEQGEIISIIGPNGAGKQRCSILTGVYQVTSGKSYLRGNQSRITGPRPSGAGCPYLPEYQAV